MATQALNKTAYWIIGGIIALAIIGFGGYKLWHHYAKSSMMQSGNTTTVNNPTQAAQDTTNSGLPNKKDTSNQQLDQDVQNVQNSMNQLQQDQGTTNSDTSNQSQDIPQQ